VQFLAGVWFIIMTFLGLGVPMPVGLCRNL
jgi:hypothetical protein